MANEQNLRPSEYKFTQEEAKKGGQKSGEARRAKKLFRETCELLLSMDCKMGNAKETMKKMGIPENEQTNQMAITISMLKAALEGNVQAYNTLRDTTGEKPINRQEITGKDGQPLQDRQLTMEEAVEFVKKVEKMI